MCLLQKQIQSFCRKAAFQNFFKFAEKHLQQSPFLAKFLAYISTTMNVEMSAKTCSELPEHNLRHSTTQWTYDLNRTYIRSPGSHMSFLCTFNLGCLSSGQVLQSRVQNPLKYLRWSFLRKQFQQLKCANCFRRKVHLRCLTGFWSPWKQQNHLD